MLSPKEASKHFPTSKTTILRDIKEGKLSASKNERGHYQIDPAELTRVYGSGSSGANHGSHRSAQWVDLKNDNGSAEFALKLEMAEKERDAAEKLAEDRQRTIDDLRDRLDKEGEERRKLTALLTDQRSAPEAPRGFLGRLWGRRS